jgi:hypothetical protein
MFRRPFRVECTLWGDDFVGVLPHLSDWLTKCHLVPRKGDTVPLPASVRAARPKRNHANGHSPEVFTLDVADKTGVVIEVYYLPTRDLVKVGIREAKRGE